MKLSLAIVASLASVVAAGNLRATTFETNQDVTTETIQSRVIMKGLLHLPTKDELVVLDKVVMETYNEAYEEADVFMAETESKGALLLASDDQGDDQVTMVISEFVSQLGLGCRFCKYNYSVCLGLSGQVR